MNLLPGRAFAMLGLGQHVGHGDQPLAAHRAHRVQLVGAHEPHEQLGDVIDQRRIGHAEPGVEGVLGQTGKEAAGCRQRERLDA